MFKKNHQSESQNTRLHNFWTNWPEVFFWGKLTIVTFVNLLCPILLKCLSLKNPYRESWDIRFCNFGQNWDQIAEFSLLEQGIRRSTALAKYLLILSLTTRKNPPFVDYPTKSFPPSTKYQFPCFNPVKTFFAFQPLSLLLDHFYFNFIHFFHSSHINFNFNQCSMFKECCF